MNDDVEGHLERNFNTILQSKRKLSLCCFEALHILDL
jgi:hypothetical protein